MEFPENPEGGFHFSPDDLKDWGEFLKRLSAHVVRLICKKISDPFVVEEIIADILSAIWKSRERMAELSQNAFSAFLYGIINHKIDDCLRKRYRAKNTEQIKEEASPEILPLPTFDLEDHAKLRWALTQIPEDLARIFVIYHNVDGITLAEIAALVYKGRRVNRKTIAHRLDKAGRMLFALYTREG